MPEPTEETEALVQAMIKVSASLPTAALKLREAAMSPEQRHTLGALLIELGDLLHQHADLDTSPATVTRQRSLWRPDHPSNGHAPS